MQDRHRVVGGMLLLTLLGLLLLVPPMTSVFNHPLSIFGVPQIVLYLFGVWLALIVGTFLLTRHVQQEPPAVDGEGEG